jgi:hypothetical protein
MAHCLVSHHITGNLVFVLVPVEPVMMCHATDNPTFCEIRTLIRFLDAKNMSAAEILLELCLV